jgi:hypothetical protein
MMRHFLTLVATLITAFAVTGPTLAGGAAEYGLASYCGQYETVYVEAHQIGDWWARTARGVVCN